MTSERRRLALEVACAGVLTAIGVSAAIVAYGYGISDADHPIGPGMTPFVVSLIVAAFAGVTAVGAAMRLRTPGSEMRRPLDESTFVIAADGSLVEVDEEKRAGADAAKPWKIVGLTAVAVIAGHWVGLLPAMAVLVFVLIAFLERAGLIRAVTIAAVNTTLVWLVFERFLEVPLPAGVLAWTL